MSIGAAAEAYEALRRHSARIVEARWFEATITTIILCNAVLLALETVPAVHARYGAVITLLNNVALVIYVVEIALRMAASGRSYFASGWSWFDMIVIGVALVPAGESLAVLRSLRVLRVLRLVAVVPSMRRVVEAFIFALPGLGWVIALLMLILFVFSVMATGLFGAAHPEQFGSLGASMFSLFTVMTLEGWPDLARTVMQTHPWAWIFFIGYLLASSFTVLNLFIGIIVDAMQSTQKEEDGDILVELRTLREEVRALRAQLSSAAPPQGTTDVRAGPE